VEVVARHRPLEVGVSLRDFVLVVLHDSPDRPVEVGLQVVLGDDPIPLLAVEHDLTGPDGGPVGEHRLDLLDVGVRDAVPDRVRSRGVVADAAADGRAIGRGGVGRELQVPLREVGVEVVLDHAGLDRRTSGVEIHIHDGVHVAREVEDDAARTDGLSRQRGARTTRKNRRVVVGRDFHRGLHVVGVSGEDDARRSRPVDASVGRVQDLRVLVEADLPVAGHSEVGRELGVLRVVGGVEVERIPVGLESGGVSRWRRHVRQ